MGSEMCIRDRDKIVYVVEDGKAYQRRVRIGDRKPGAVEIIDGLAAGEIIVTAGQMKLFEGASVQAAGSPAADVN